VDITVHEQGLRAASNELSSFAPGISNHSIASVEALRADNNVVLRSCTACGATSVIFVFSCNIVPLANAFPLDAMSAAVGIKLWCRIRNLPGGGPVKWNMKRVTRIRGNLADIFGDLLVTIRWPESSVRAEHECSTTIELIGNHWHDVEKGA
jgi:hypothetical protein